MKMKKRNAKTLFLLSLALAAGLVFGAGARGAFAGMRGGALEAVRKSDVGYEEDENIQVGAQSANVLFFLDTSYSMMFDPRGKLPFVVLDSKGEIDGAATKKKYGYDKAGAIDMMKYATFGVGTVPPIDSFFIDYLFKAVNYGRDTDERNNLGYGGGSTDINHPDNYFRYYSPYAAKHNLGPIFKNQRDAYPGTDKKSGLGYYFKDTKAIVNGKPLPYMLVFKNPKFWEKGMPGFDPKNPKHREELVPNDSRMYQTKLVLWRLLEDSGLFMNIRFGLAMGYANALTPEAQTGFTDNPPYAGATRDVPEDSAAYKVAPWGADGTYKYGAFYITEEKGLAYSNQKAGGAQGATWEVSDDAGIREWNLQQRAFLAVPFAEYDKVWVTQNGQVSMTHADRFRQWIDGIEDVAGQYQMGGSDSGRKNPLNIAQFSIHKNPEVKVSSSRPIARMIYPNIHGDNSTNSKDPGWTWYLQNKGIAYAKRDSIFMRGADENDRYNFYFKPGSGEAVGAIIDFFSPDYGSFGSTDGVSGLGMTNHHSAGSDGAESYADMIDEQFPIRNICDPNYLIIFTAGESDAPGYPTEKAIKRLYDQTKQWSVTVMYYENGQRKFRR
ncbi:MAG: hypothetical protein LBU26_03440, partial [Synergistaceae bacterium]|nr:hypothetical protein [Synergistaceae bacterium]